MFGVILQSSGWYRAPMYMNHIQDLCAINYFQRLFFGHFETLVCKHCSLSIFCCEFSHIAIHSTFL